MTSSHKIVFLIHNCNFVTVIDHNSNSPLSHDLRDPCERIIQPQRFMNHWLRTRILETVLKVGVGTERTSGGGTESENIERDN